MELSLTTKQLFALIRSGVGSEAPDSHLFRENVDWDALFNLAQSQGVIGFCFEGIKKLRTSNEKRDETILTLMKFAGYASIIKKQYQTHLQAASELAKELKSQGCDCLIIKGLALAPYYPIPEERSFGDMDIYSFGNQDKVNAIISSKGIGIDYGVKHDVFKYNTITVEQHRSFVGLINDSARIINDFLVREGQKENCIQTKDSWFMPSHRFNAVFLLRHMAKHYFGEGICIKQILDWGLFLKATSMEELNVSQILEKSRMVTAWNTFTFVAEVLLDDDFSSFYIGKPSELLGNRVLMDVIDYHPWEIRNKGLIIRTALKAKRLFATKWMFDSGLLPDAFWKDVVWRSIIDHIKRPKFF